VAVLVLAAVPAWPHVADEVTSPKVDTSGVNLQPAYPASALAARERGAVVLNVEVGETGIVSRILPLQSSGFNDLDASAISTVMGWRFAPATRNGKPEEGWAKERIVFQPPDEPAAPLATSTTAYLPVALDLDSGEREKESQEKPVPCARGEVRATLEIRKLRGHSSSASIMLRAGNEKAELITVEYRDAEKVFLVYSQGQDHRWLAFNKIASAESPVGLTLSWEPNGSVTGMIGKLQTMQIRLSSAPAAFGFAVDGAAATFRSPQLICLAPSTPPE
jgi:TonB family protein